MQLTLTILCLYALQGERPDLSPSEWRLGALPHNERRDLEVQVCSPGAEFRVFVPCSCISFERLGGGRVRLTLFTQGLLGAHDYTLQFVVTEGRRTSILRFPVSFEVRSRRPAASGPPDLFLRYRREDSEILARFAEVSRARGGTEEAVRSDVTELVERDRRTSGAEAVARRLLELGAVEPAEGPARGRRIFFYSSPDCPTCRWLRTRFFPPLEEEHDFSVELRPLSDEANLRGLWGLLRKHGRQDFQALAVLAGDRLFVGLEEVRDLLPRYLALDPPLGEAAPAAADLGEEFAGIGAGAVAVAGLVDGLNPCAFVTAVFLVSFLAASGYRRGAALGVGAAFAGAVLVTYFLVGLGLLTFARAWGASDAVRYAAAGLVIALAAVSLYDASAYAATGRGVALQLPRSLKERIHEAIRTRLRARNVALGAAVAGVLVTLFEAVCTGQVYLPTIVAMTRREETAGRAMALLAVYNLAFIVPLLALLGATVFGVSSRRLGEWSRRNVVLAKAAMAVLFLGLAAYLLA